MNRGYFGKRKDRRRAPRHAFSERVQDLVYSLAPMERVDAQEIRRRYGVTESQAVVEVQMAIGRWR